MIDPAYKYFKEIKELMKVAESKNPKVGRIFPKHMDALMDLMWVTVAKMIPKRYLLNGEMGSTRAPTYPEIRHAIKGLEELQKFWELRRKKDE